MTSPGAFDGVVLCGGESRRMGRDKALVEIDGVPMAVRVADALARAGATRVCTVGGDGHALSSLGLAHVDDPWPGEGPLGGLVAALDQVGDAPAVAVLACDLLRPSAKTIDGLVTRLGAGRADAVIPSVDGRAQWMHAVWRRRVAGLLTAVFRSGERSVFGAVAGLDIDFAPAPDPAPFADADVPADLPGTT